MDDANYPFEPAPTPEEVERIFTRLLDGSCSRDDADRWAAQWFGKDHAPPMPQYIWKALGVLYGCDLRSGPDEPYLHDHDQIAGWLETFRTERQEHET